MTYAWIAIVTLFNAAAFGAPLCPDLLMTFKGEPNGSIVYNINARGARAQAYPLDFTLANLGLSAESLAALGPHVLLLGEGYGALFPALNKIPGLEVQAVDPIYALDPIPAGFMGDHLREFLKHHQSTGKLHAESSHQTGFPNGWADSVIAHMVLNNFIDANGNWQSLAWDTVNEAIRVVRLHGQIRLASFNRPAELELLTDLARHQTPTLWQDVSYFIQSRMVDVRYDDFGTYALDLSGVEIKNKTISTLVITKVK